MCSPFLFAVFLTSCSSHHEEPPGAGANCEREENKKKQNNSDNPFPSCRFIRMEAIQIVGNIFLYEYGFSLLPIGLKIKAVGESVRKK